MPRDRIEELEAELTVARAELAKVKQKSRATGREDVKALAVSAIRSAIPGEEHLGQTYSAHAVFDVLDDLARKVESL